MFSSRSSLKWGSSVFLRMFPHPRHFALYVGRSPTGQAERNSWTPPRGWVTTSLRPPPKPPLPIGPHLPGDTPASFGIEGVLLPTALPSQPRPLRSGPPPPGAPPRARPAPPRPASPPSWCVCRRWHCWGEFAPEGSKMSERAEFSGFGGDLPDKRWPVKTNFHGTVQHRWSQGRQIQQADSWTMSRFQAVSRRISI